MSKSALFLAGLLALVTSPVFAQVVVTSRPVVTYYAPAVVSPAPVVTYSPVTTYYAPLAEAVPVTSYYAPIYTVTPTTTYYTPVTAYYSTPVAVPVYGRPVVVGRSAYGTLRPYVPGQPVRNTLRFSLP